MSQTDNTELVVINQPLPPAVSEPEQDNANWGEDEAPKPEYIALKQPTTDGVDHVTNGHFYHKASGQTWSEIKMVVLQMHKGRSWKPSAPVFVVGEKVKCRSINRTQTTSFKNGVQTSNFPITGNSFLEPQAKDCNKCSKNSWAGYDKVTKEGPKPVCQRDFYFLFLDSKTNLPYIYTASGKGLDPSDAIYDAVKARAKLVKAKTGRMPSTFEFELVMTSEKDGKYYKPKFTTVRQLTPEDAAKYGPLFEQFVASRKQAPIETEDGETTTYEADDTGAVLDSADEPAVAI